MISIVSPVRAVQVEIPQWNALGYCESIVHGDSHPDNILIYRDLNPVQLDASGLRVWDREFHAFLIDFTHTEVGHASLDYIIMDAMLRSQVLRGLLSELLGGEGSRGIGDAVKKWLLAECMMNGGRVNEAVECVSAIPVIGDRCGALLRLSSWLRESCRRRNFGEGLGFYWAGLGLTIYAFVGLPDESNVGTISREILLVISSLALTKALDEGVGDTWIASNIGNTELDSRLAESVKLWVLRGMAWGES